MILAGLGNLSRSQLVGSGNIKPIQASVEKILDFGFPNVEKDLQGTGEWSVTGGSVVNSQVVCPMTDLLSKTAIIWSQDCANAFRSNM